MLLPVLLLSTAALASERRAEKIATRAEKALLSGNVGRAWELAGKAREKDPENTRAMGIQAVLLIGSATPDNPMAAEMLNEGMALTNQLAALAPDSPYLTLARSTLQEMTDPALITEPRAECSDEAHAQLEKAERAFGQRDMQTAGTFYRRALDLCPEATAWWTYYGDTWFGLGDYAQARENYQRSLDLDPCFWPAHRFWANSLLQEGDLVGARDHTATAVACNPEYTIGWRFLEMIVSEGGGTFGWQAVDKPALTTGEEGANIDLFTSGPFSGPAGLVYQTTRASSTGTPLEIERQAVEKTLTMFDELSGGLDPLWQALAAARDAGYLDEAIFIFLLDEALLPEFLAHRDAHRDRLAAYVAAHLAPLSGE